MRRAPSSSAICEQMRASREVLNQQRAHRFSCSAENIHDALKNVNNVSLLSHAVSTSCFIINVYTFRLKIVCMEVLQAFWGVH